MSKKNMKFIFSGGTEMSREEIIAAIRKQHCRADTRILDIVGYPLHYVWGRPHTKWCFGYGDEPKQLILSLRDPETAKLQWLSLGITEKEFIIRLIEAEHNREIEYLKSPFVVGGRKNNMEKGGKIKGGN